MDSDYFDRATVTTDYYYVTFTYNNAQGKLLYQQKPAVKCTENLLGGTKIF